MLASANAKNAAFAGQTSKLSYPCAGSPALKGSIITRCSDSQSIVSCRTFEKE